jgi:hypothetical protein
MGGRRFPLEDRIDLDLLAERWAKQLCDIEHGRVDVDVARLKRLAAGKGEQVLDQFAAAFRRLVDQLGGLLQPRPILQARDQGLGGAGDHGQHVVEVVRDAAGELADGVELLRLLQLVLGFARGGGVVVDQRRAADGARGIAQRPSADHEMNGGVAANWAHHDFDGVERFAAQRPRCGHVLNQHRGDAVGMKDRAERAQQLDRPSRPVAQHLLRGRVGEQNLALGVDDEHRFRHTVKGAPQDCGREPEFLVRGDQMLGALGDRGFQRLVGGLGGAQRILQLPARTAGRQRQNGGEDQNQCDACEIDRQQECPGGFGFGAPLEEQSALFRHRPFQVSRDRGRGRAVLLTNERRDGGAISRTPELDQLTIDCDLALHQRLGLFDQLLFGRIVLDRLDQCRQRRQDRVAGLAVFPGEFLIA